MSTHRIQARALTSEAFAPFGDVIEHAGARRFEVNAGTSIRFHDLAEVDVATDQGRPCVSIFRAQPHALPFAVRLLEHHPLSSQAFVPMEPTRFLVVVAPAGKPPIPETIEAFISNGHQGVNYRKSTWHHPLVALESETDFLVLDRAGPGDNLEEWTPSEPIHVEVDG